MQKIIVWTLALVVSVMGVSSAWAQSNTVVFGQVDNGRGLGLSALTYPYVYVGLYRAEGEVWSWVNSTKGCWDGLDSQGCANANGDFAFTRDSKGESLSPGRYMVEVSAVDYFIARAAFDIPGRTVGVSIRRRPLTTDWETSRLYPLGRQTRVIFDLIKESPGDLGVVIEYVLSGPIATEYWDEIEKRSESRTVRDFRTRLDQTFSLGSVSSGSFYCLNITVREEGGTNKLLVRSGSCSYKPR